MYKRFTLIFLIIFSLSVVQAQESVEDSKTQTTKTAQGEHIGNEECDIHKINFMRVYIIDYHKNLDHCMRLAEKGEVDAQYTLGVMYDLGVGVKEDKEEAVKWYTLAAEHGHALAQFQLGLTYDVEVEVYEDEEETPIEEVPLEEILHMLETPSILNTVAQEECDLGKSFYKGIGVDIDYQKALNHFKKAAIQGNVEAQFYLGLMYYKGHGVKKDYSIAVRWYNLAAEQGYADAQYNLASLYLRDKGVKQSQAIYWLTQAATKGKNEQALITLGRYYENRENYQEAVKWYMLAAEQGDEEAQYNLGYIYIKGKGVVKEDHVKAAKWFRKAAEQGHAEAQFYLGQMYGFGFYDGVEEDEEEALKWYRKAAEQGHEDAKSRVEYIKWRRTSR